MLFHKQRRWHFQRCDRTRRLKNLGPAFTASMGRFTTATANSTVRRITSAGLFDRKTPKPPVPQRWGPGRFPKSPSSAGLFDFLAHDRPPAWGDYNDDGYPICSSPTPWAVAVIPQQRQRHFHRRECGSRRSTRIASEEWRSGATTTTMAGSTSCRSRGLTTRMDLHDAQRRKGPRMANRCASYHNNG